MNHDHGKGMGKHMLLMLVCCLVPLALIMAVSMFGLSLGPLQPIVPYVAALMCPLMMVVMMRGMFMSNQDANHSHQHGNALTAPKQALPGNPQGATETVAVADKEKCH